MRFSRLEKRVIYYGKSCANWAFASALILQSVTENVSCVGRHSFWLLHIRTWKDPLRSTRIVHSSFDFLTHQTSWLLLNVLKHISSWNSKSVALFNSSCCISNFLLHVSTGKVGFIYMWSRKSFRPIVSFLASWNNLRIVPLYKSKPGCHLAFTRSPQGQEGETRLTPGTVPGHLQNQKKARRPL